jgi:hypothetical protein
VHLETVISSRASDAGPPLRCSAAFTTTTEVAAVAPTVPLALLCSVLESVTAVVRQSADIGLVPSLVGALTTTTLAAVAVAPGGAGRDILARGASPADARHRCPA